VPETVTLAEVAGRIGGPVELARTLAERARAKIETRWDGAPTISDAAAATIVAEHEAEAKADYIRRRDVLDAHKRWQDERQQAYSKAFRAELAKAVQRERDYIETLAVEGSAAFGDDTGRGWASGGGYPAGFRRPSASAHSKAVEAGREARNRYDAKHPEPV
jgi:hypothetical protein